MIFRKHASFFSLFGNGIDGCPSRLSRKSNGIAAAMVAPPPFSCCAIAARTGAVTLSLAEPVADLFHRHARSDTDADHSEISSGSAVLNLGSNYLERLGNQVSGGIAGALRGNPRAAAPRKQPK